ncbi:hypothetical protein BJ875DRAFT_200650 [Amylocarpus encephaloides]|uniref:Uncharacterized protein n=1 Tax=Amylocarpus encephaloides TaxID=45428 RepID=A0A9P7Y912_9HELO|nr:hypothetical protein BJ875DRAFT_200650 [Amylocarpus encephaloides]
MSHMTGLCLDSIINWLFTSSLLLLLLAMRQELGNRPFSHRRRILVSEAVWDLHPNSSTRFPLIYCLQPDTF